MKKKWKRHRKYRNHLRRHRRAMGYSQTDIAWMLGINDTDIISRWELGICLPSSKYLFKLESIYHTLAAALYYDLTLQIREELRLKEAEFRKRVEARCNSPNSSKTNRSRR